MRRFYFYVVITTAILFASTMILAQDVTETPEILPPDYLFEFPLDPPTDAEIEDAFACELALPQEDSAGSPSPDSDGGACALAQQALELARNRGETDPVSEAEIELLRQFVAENPALAPRLAVIATYFNVGQLVAPPAFTDQPIVEMRVEYSFSGLGSSVHYDLTITNADTEPQISGVVDNSGGIVFEGETPEPETPLPDTVDPEVIQAFGAALSDLLPIEGQLTQINCTDFYPDWIVTLTFEDGTTMRMVTNGTNLIGQGGPWQAEIDGRNYLQYSVAFEIAMVDLFEALDLSFGETAAMTCFGVDDQAMFMELYPHDFRE